MSESAKSNTKGWFKKHGKFLLLVISVVLTILLVVCIFYFCQTPETYSHSHHKAREDAQFTGPVPFTTVYPTTEAVIRQSRGIHKEENPYARCGPECQNKSKFFDPNAYPGPYLPYYPVLPGNPNQASPASGAWLHNATPEDVHNLTVPVKIKGKKVPFKCNKSCPPQEVACGLDQRGLHRGVM